MKLKKIFFLTVILILLTTGLSYGGELKIYQQGKAKIVEIPYGSLEPSITLGKGYIGGTEELAGMAKRSGAVVAINGGFFEAYHGKPEPWNNLILNGQVVHCTSTGTTMGFTRDGRIIMEPIRIKIQGGIDGSYSWPNNWYAYGFNHTQKTNGIFIYTKERGETLGFAKGISVVVVDGWVVGKAYNENLPIPKNGYIINFSGNEEKLAARFNLGSRVDYKVYFENGKGDWSEVVTGLGAGPRLVIDGQVSLNPLSEGFTEKEIISENRLRSAIGIKKNGTILLVTASGTIGQIAALMKKLGAYQAMNLDGGASSGLWVEGKYLTKPGRLLSNALIFK